jgi:hypothetical protein
MSEQELHRVIVASYKECKELGYYPAYFMRMPLT